MSWISNAYGFVAFMSRIKKEEKKTRNVIKIKYGKKLSNSMKKSKSKGPFEEWSKKRPEWQI